MRIDRNTLISLLLLVVIAALYRAMPGRVWGFAPHIAMAIFGGSVIRDRRLAFALPLLSLLLSDLLYHVLHLQGLTPISGFYSGQWLNYILIGLLTFIGFAVRSNSVTQVFAGSLAGPLAYFLLSNLTVWIGGGGYARPKTFTGLLQCYADGLPFLQTSLYGTFFFSVILFGGYHLLGRLNLRPQVRA
jgi:hypothetical protein